MSGLRGTSNSKTKQEELSSLIEWHGYYVKLDHPIRFCLTPHSDVRYITEVFYNNTVEDFGEAIDAVLQRLRWMKHLKINEPNGQ